MRRVRITTAELPTRAAQELDDATGKQPTCFERQLHAGALHRVADVEHEIIVAVVPILHQAE